MYVDILYAYLSSEEGKIVDVVRGNIKLECAFSVGVAINTLAISGDQRLVGAKHGLRQLRV